ncbi:hypothetical protein [Sphingobium chungangianum]
MSTFEESAIKDGDRIDATDIPSALTRAPFTYADGATQVFTSDGRTVYTERGRPSPGEWKVDEDGRFQSFWPPSEYTSYDLTWIAGPDGEAVGIRFVDPNRGSTFEGRYSRD